MRAILISIIKVEGVGEARYRRFLEVVYKFIEKGAFKSENVWKGILHVLKNLKRYVDVRRIKGLPEEKRKEVFSICGVLIK